MDELILRVELDQRQQRFTGLLDLCRDERIDAAFLRRRASLAIEPLRSTTSVMSVRSDLMDSLLN